MTDVPLVQLIDATGRPYDFVVRGDTRTYADLVKPSGLREVDRYADGIGTNKDVLIPRDAAGNLTTPTTVVRDAHREGLLVHAWTFRPENEFLPTNLRAGDPQSPVYRQARGEQPKELAIFYRLGLDGVFADNADTAVAVRTKVFRAVRGKAGRRPVSRRP